MRGFFVVVDLFTLYMESKAHFLISNHNHTNINNIFMKLSPNPHCVFVVQMESQKYFPKSSGDISYVSVRLTCIMSWRE